MEQSDTTPTKEGYYWFWDPKHDDPQPIIVRIARVSGGGLVVDEFNKGRSEPLSEAPRGRWLGPIPLPDVK